MTASQHMIQANGLRFRVLADGPPDGELVLLLHGFPEGAESWTRQIDAIAHSGALAVAPDVRDGQRAGVGDRVDLPRPRFGPFWESMKQEDQLAVRRTVGQDAEAQPVGLDHVLARGHRRFFWRKSAAMSSASSRTASKPWPWPLKTSSRASEISLIFAFSRSR